MFSRGRVSRLLQYGFAIALNAASSLLVIPAIVGAAGLPAWGNLAVGQTVGAFLAVCVSLGWAVTGPSLAAAAAPREVWRLLTISLAARSLFVLPALLVAVALCSILLTGWKPEAFALAASLIAGSVSAAWVLVGRGHTLAALVTDTLPRTVSTVIGVVLLVQGAPVMALPVSQLLGAVSALVFGTAYVWRRYSSGRAWNVSGHELIAAARNQSHGATTAVLSALYVALPVMFVAMLAPADAPVYTIADRLLKYLIYASAPLSGLAQAWVPRGGSAVLGRRSGIAVRAGIAAGLIGGIGYGLLAPVAASVLSHRQLAVGLDLAVPLAAACGAILCTQVVGPAVLSLVSRGRSLTASVLLGAGVGVVLIPAGAHFGGASGAGVGFAASEIAVLYYQLRAAAGFTRSV